MTIPNRLIFEPTETRFRSTSSLLVPRPGGFYGVKKKKKKKKISPMFIPEAYLHSTYVGAGTQGRYLPR